MKTLLTILMLLIAIATYATMVDDSEQAKKFYRTVVEYISQKQADDKSDVVIARREPQTKIRYEEPQTKRKPSFLGVVSRPSQNKLVIALRSIDFGSNQVDYIRKNRDSIPKGLKLSTVTNALRSIDFDSYRVEALELLKNKIDRNYTDREFEEFLKVFDFSSYKVKATSILPTSILHRK